MTPMLGDMARKLGAAASMRGAIRPMLGAAAPMFGSTQCWPGFYDASARGPALRRRRRRAKSR